MLGIDIRRAAVARGTRSIACSRAELDVTDAPAVHAAIGAVNVDAVLNLRPIPTSTARRATVQLRTPSTAPGPGNVASAARRAGAWTIHVSSDYVFDGAKRTPYLESDTTGPLSVYGESKLAGERAVAQAAPGSHTIVRSSWLFGTGGPCFPATMLRLAAERDQLTVVDDQLGCPTFTGHLAAHCWRSRATVAAPSAPASSMSRLGASAPGIEFAREIMSAAGARRRSTRAAPLRSDDPLAAALQRAAHRARRRVPQIAALAAGLADYMAAR